MTEKNTPEFNHYQHNAPEYTEEVLWHRVYAVAATVLLVVALSGWGLYNLFKSDEPGNAPFKVEALAPSAAIPTAEDPAQTTTTTTEPAAAANAVADTEEAEPEETVAITSEAVTDEPVEVTPEPADNRTESDTMAVIDHTPSAADDSYQVKVTILNADITHAALTDRIKELEPAREINSTTALDDGFLKLYFYTDLSGRAGDTLTYSWYRDEKRVARVRIPVGSDRWRSHASKNISAKMRGSWKVVVTDRKGETLATSEFYLKPNAS